MLKNSVILGLSLMIVACGATNTSQLQPDQIAVIDTETDEIVVISDPIVPILDNPNDCIEHDRHTEVYKYDKNKRKFIKKHKHND